MLAELVRHLAKMRAIASAMGSAKLLEHPLDVMGETFPILRSFGPVQISEVPPPVLKPGSVVDAGALINPLDLFV